MSVCIFFSAIELNIISSTPCKCTPNVRLFTSINKTKGRKFFSFLFENNLPSTAKLLIMYAKAAQVHCIDTEFENVILNIDFFEKIKSQKFTKLKFLDIYIYHSRLAKPIKIGKIIQSHPTIFELSTLNLSHDLNWANNTKSMG